MKVLFVYGGYENLGIEYLSAVLRKAGHRTALAFDPRLFDDHYTRVPSLARLFDSSPALLRKAKEEAPDLVAFSVVTDDYPWVRQIANEMRRELRVPFVFGGVHVTSTPRRIINSGLADFAIVGEGEGALLDLVEGLEKGSDLDGVDNLWFRRGDEVMANPPRPLVEDLDTLPFPDKSLFYDTLPFLRRDYVVITSRGCPHSCTYCFNNFQRRMYAGTGRYCRRRSAGNVLAELIRARSRYPLRRIQFYDDVFTSDASWLEAFADGYSREVGLPFWCSVNPLHVSPNVVELLREMGCWEVQMGVQTIDPTLRREVLGRRESTEQVQQAIELFRAADIKCVVDNISGIPGEAEDHFVKTLAFYNATRPSRISNYHLRYYPATEIVSKAEEHGILDRATVERLEDGGGSESFALGGTTTAHTQAPELHFLLDLLLLLPSGLNETILSRRLYRYLPRRNFFVRSLIRMMDVVRKRDINAERYYLKYVHFLGRALRDSRG